MTLLPRLTRVLSVVALGGVLVLAPHLSGSAQQRTADGDPLTTSPALRTGAEAAALMRVHGCWSGAAPRDNPVPGHSVVDLGEGPVYAPADDGFDIWLHGRQGRLYGFCR